ncbi:glycine betaine/L-proline ABC transporter ATP-binding protein [Muricomes intestini]|uniref:quaternary amine ABC transporter ATP-binding protein n=1 Tax=Muricomes intestini TaxID=1796634 RepID=UPI002FDFB8DD
MESKKNMIEVQNISKLYGLNKSEAAKMMREGSEKEAVQKKTGVSVALWDVNMKIPQGQIFVIIGLSGSGKSTLVRCFNRLNKPTSGKVLFEGKDLATLSKKELLEFRRNKIAMVFQSFGLMSHRDVLGNVAYGLEIKGISKEEREKKAMEVISMVGLNGWEHQSCDSLSGGMRQRVGIARALTNDPDVLLMDEPFSALDPLVRQDMQFELLQIQRKLRKTVVFITHDIDEAFNLGDVVAIMKDGKVIQTDTPEQMSEHPANEYVEAFINNADKSRVLSVYNIMITPKTLVRVGDGVEQALRVMNKNELSTVYVVDDNLHLVGILSIADAVHARQNHLPIADVVQKDIPVVDPDTLVADIMALAAEAPYPIAAVGKDGQLKGIVTKAKVLSSLV